MSDNGRNKVHLVGSVPFASTEEVFRTCARYLGGIAASLPDGEVGDRQIWINFLALRTYYMHPGLDSVRRPQPVDGQEQWIPKGLDDHWQFKLKDGVRSLEFEDLRYAGTAIGSYLEFRRLRHEGVIPAGTRFQVALPLTWSGTMLFFLQSPEDLELVAPAYERAMIRELEKLALAIPPEDLTIQWDVCAEVLDIEGLFPSSPPGDKFQRFVDACARLAPHVPEQALLGYHFCYADLGHKHMKEPDDLALSVRMANAAHADSGRRVDFYHLTVPRDRDDDAYFRPLSELAVGDGLVFLGLLHHTDGVEGAVRRMAAARRHLAGFGVATECGFGRRPPEQVTSLLELHRTIAARL